MAGPPFARWHPTGGAFDVVAEWIGANGYVSAGEPWESYLDGPEVAEPRTLVRFPCHLA